MITLKNISRIYSRKSAQEDVIALDNINLTLPDKGFVSIVGASGSGKTTLLNIIGGLDRPTSGEMIVDDISTSSFKEIDWDAYRNEKIGFVLQNCYLLPHLSIKDNIAIKLQISNHKYENIDEMVDNALKEVDLLDKKFDKPKSLSGGQKQRAAIARALVGKPTVLLADEPTGALDSKNGKAIMELLKKLSKDHLVVMVTHNKEYASTYSDRIVELSDGHIISDSSSIKEEVKALNNKINKVSFPFFTSIKWGFKNLLLKKYSTISIILAVALGLGGVGLILSISSGVKDAFKVAEKDALRESPVVISSYSPQTPEGNISDYVEFTDEESVFVDLTAAATQKHLNYMSSNFLSYMDKMPKGLYSVRYDSSATSFNVYTKMSDTKYGKISSTSSYFYKAVDNEEFIEHEYDCLKGKFPTEVNEVALVVDSYNKLTGSTLYSLGFDIDTSHYKEMKLSFDDIIGKEYHYISNNEYYEYNSTKKIYETIDKTYKEFYDESNFSLKIVGIIREKKDSENPLFRTGIIYTQKFNDKMVKESNESEIVKAQLQEGLKKNVLTGEPFTDQHTLYGTYSKEYVYEAQLYTLGALERITTLYYFTEDYASRSKIEEYFNSYIPIKDVDNSTMTYNDYLKKIAYQFDGALSMMTTVLYAFAAISVFVAAILNGILTYISVHQRTSEIGLLRSLGVRRKDIALMVETESMLTGLIGSIIAIIAGLALVYPINGFVTQAIYRYNFYLLSTTTFDLGGFKWWVAPIVIGIGLLTSLISAIIPAYVASKKDPAHAISE